MPSWLLNVEYLYGEPFACHRKQRSATAACNIYLGKKSYVDWLSTSYIFYIYLYISLLSLAHSVAIAHSHIYHLLSFFFFCLQCNKNGDGPEITITKKQTQKIEEGERRVRPGRTAAVCCPSLTVAAERTQSAWCSDIKEEAAEAPSP